MTTRPSNTDFVISYEFNAPKELVFNAFSKAEALNEWWGPLQTKNSVVSLDFRPGGIFHFKMESPGTTNYGRFIFGSIQPYDLLEFTNSFADEHANVVPAPFDISIPDRIFYRIIFSETNGKTTITMTGQPVDATPEQETGFHSINASMQEGFGASFKQLTTFLSKIEES
ncbi:SRPBCC domain-containing protein [Emticicia sp. C21]|uniref:SRPBCC family protein n=1 Tax=Emticicia sp. C21 TaxID=2302915 RepID=UPI000E34F140|nr:SRPBCC domain-containing protein [Emticicia sp. C21]RFS14363.1 SRPBCC domain-containing protein [Emticicia sp. C21]